MVGFAIRAATTVVAAFSKPLATKGKAMELIIRVIIDMIRDLLRDK